MEIRWKEHRTLRLPASLVVALRRAEWGSVRGGRYKTGHYKAIVSSRSVGTLPRDHQRSIKSTGAWWKASCAEHRVEATKGLDWSCVRSQQCMH